MSIFKRSFRDTPYATYLFLLIQSIIFLAMQITPAGSTSIKTIVNFGGLYNPYVTQLHEYWRFITPIFVHIGFYHFLFNAFVLFFLGEQVENLYGHVRFFLIYLLSGVSGNILSFALHNESVSAGASTSLFGMFGAFIILKHYFSHNLVLSTLARQYTFLVALNLIFNLFDSSTDIWGHIGGFFSGLLAGIALAVPKQARYYRIIERLSAGILLIIFLVIFLKIGFTKTKFA
ncbi:MAG: rhomboid family intramembrane serine protease [Streptococcaceae bacterium]|jgi:rhomboid protease GluP|nr:rhomboid family intramembrane serine protease [Streptococcaceae bacterium]